MKFFLVALGVAIGFASISTASNRMRFSPADGQNDPSVCQGPTIQRIPRPYNSDFPKRVFSYAFDYAPATGNKPTIIYMPGGPGETSIGGTAMRANFPDGYGSILTDPRGVGCNGGLTISDPLSFYRTEELAKDVIAIVRTLKLDNYVLYGISYGTYLATAVASILDKQESFPPPKALVLEGVLGRAFLPGETLLGYLNQWNRIYAQLPDDVVVELSKDAPMGIDAATWANWYEAVGMYANYPKPNLDFVQQLLLKLAPSTTIQEQQALINYIKTFATSSQAAEKAVLHKYVACREVSVDGATSGSEIVLMNGQMILSANEGTECSGLSIDHPYDVRDFPVQTKTYYFSGDHDPATPTWQANYHFDYNTGADRVLVRIKGGGHNSLVLNEGAACAKLVFAAIGENPSGLQSALSSCPLPSEQWIRPKQ
jgi:pimeloyl-ACP methyl ester carboxylesterase